jgi:transposase
MGSGGESVAANGPNVRGGEDRESRGQCGSRNRAAGWRGGAGRRHGISDHGGEPTSTMLNIAASQRIYLAVEPVDMRKQFNGLWSLAEQKLQENPRGGSVFVFVNKDRDRLKMLYFDGTWTWVFAKRLEKGRFTWPVGSDRTKLSLAPEALTMLQAAIDLQDSCKKAWYERA